MPDRGGGKITAAEKEAAVEKYFADKWAAKQPGQVTATVAVQVADIIAAVAAAVEVPIFVFQQSSLTRHDCTRRLRTSKRLTPRSTGTALAGAAAHT